MKEYNGENPQNARIKISYANKKPKVKFSYPVSKKDATRGSMFPTIFGILFLISLLITTIIFGNLEEQVHLVMVLTFLISTILSVLIYFPFKKKWNALYPDFKAFLEIKKYKRFIKRDLRIDHKGKDYLELPIFNNIVCDFNATRDFSKYLEEFEIEEYKFEYNEKKIMKSTKKKQRPKNEFIWYARWYFKEKPTKGFIEVLFK